MQKHTIDFSLQAFPTLDLVSIILPNLRTALWGFWHPLVAILQHRFKVLQKNSPFLDAFWLLYATQFYSLDPCFLHHPSASTPHIYFYFELHYYSAKSLAQRNSSTTSPIVWTRRKYQKELATLLLHSPPYLTFHHQLRKPFFNAVAPSTIHRLAQFLFSITHEQTKLPTHTLLALAMNIFPPQACKKLTTNENKKTKKMKP